MGELITKLNDFYRKDILKSLYHGTTKSHSRVIQKSINCNKSVRTKDFGKGFYLTSNFELAKQSAIKTSAREKGMPHVLEFEVKKEAYHNNYSILVFDTNDEEWLGYILSNKSESKKKALKFFPNKYSELYHIVYGPLADGIPKYFSLVNEFNKLENIVEKDKERFRKSVSQSFEFPKNDQIRFYTKDINEILILQKIHEIK